MRTIVLAADHGGFKLKEIIKEFLQQDKNIKIFDLGTYSEESVDYPVFAEKAARTVASGQADQGIVFCGTGIGITIAANKIKGIRAANCTTIEMAEMSRRHNNANILGLGGRILDPELAKKIVMTWLTTPFEGDRHQRRIDQIDKLDKQFN